jgi:hypothetical protein
MESVDSCSRSKNSISSLYGKKIELIFLSILYYTVYTDYLYYFSGNCSPLDIGIARFGEMQGSFCSVQLFGAWSYQIQQCTAGLLQSISSETVIAWTLS